MALKVAMGKLADSSQSVRMRLSRRLWLLFRALMSTWNSPDVI